MADLRIVGTRSSSRPVRQWSTRLEGAESWSFRLVWIHRSRRWSLDLRTLLGAPVFVGRTVVTGIDMLGDVSTVGRPPGQLFVVDEAGVGGLPGLGGWSDGFEMLYRPISDVPGAVGTSREVR